MGTKKRLFPIKGLYPHKNESASPTPPPRKAWVGSAETYKPDPRHHAPSILYGIENILKAVTKLPRSRPFQIFEAYLTVEVRFVKNEFYLCFDGIREIPIYQQVYKGRRNGLPPSEVLVDLNPHPKCPGKYSTLLRFEQDGKEGKLKITQPGKTWKWVA